MFDIKMIEKRIQELKPIKPWEVICWVQQKLKQARENGSEKLFDVIIELLPRAIILALGFDTHRSVIFQITEEEYNRVADCISERHPPEKRFPRRRMPPPIRELVENGRQEIYISNPLKDSRTEYMRKLIEDENIKAVYYTKVDVSVSETYVLVVDAAGECVEINDDERRFLDILCQVIKEVEEERAKYEKEIIGIVENRRKEMAIFLLGMIHHIFRNKVMSIGGLAKNLNKSLRQEGNCALQKEQAFLRAIIDGSQNLENVLWDFGNLTEKLRHGYNLQKCCLAEVLPPLIESEHKIIKNVNIITDPERARFLFRNLVEKLQDALCRVEKQGKVIFFSSNKNALQEISNLIKIIKRKKVESKNCYNVYSLENLLLAFAIMMFRETGGDVMVYDHCIEIIFTSVS